MRYKDFAGFPEDIRVGDVILSAFEGPIKVEMITRRNGGYDFLSNITNMEWHLYDLYHFPDDATMHVRRDTLKETLKLL